MRPVWLLLGLVLPLLPFGDGAGGARGGTGAEYVQPSHGAESPFLAPSGISLPAAAETGAVAPGSGRARADDARRCAGAWSTTPEAAPGTFVPLCQRLPFHANAPPRAGRP